ncbi:glycosyltransferase family 2 protein [Aquiflexum gelatinilyticum]|uniref:Glycosyltransferase n=1 Tax=Aquiflexum gelatinilyticum TaxID=2961943 RepID=A0A9X2P5V0_9BACT|nr:glycosyltransferase family 2 protein [Aquiflexum gelatinilyticum]MCR9014848.1 glycosyltransferase [Aquiflexum gelatinilyticum]
MDFKVSIIIPVFNVELFLEEAVTSAINIKEVGEVLLVEDGSSDNSLALCEKLAKEFPKVRLIVHENNVNRGVSISRNLGVANATFDYVAFLDADDWYLPQRFEIEKQVFESNPDVDGVYGGTGFFFENTGTLDPLQLTTVNKITAPEDLIFTLLDGKGDRFTTDAITFKRSFFIGLGGFDQMLKLAEDTDLWMRASVKGKLFPGQIDSPIAIRRVHDNNSFKKINQETTKALYEKLFRYFLLEGDIPKKAFAIIFKRYIGTRTNSISGRYFNAIIEIMKNPKCIRKLI